MKKITVPARDDACWDDAAWRLTTLRNLQSAHFLSPAAIGDLTGVKTTTVYNWFTKGSPREIPVNSLRLLMLELRASRHVK